MYAVESFELGKIYKSGKIKALDNFSLQVETGKIFSLLGPNGAGKTTFIKLLLGIIFPTSGSAKILGEPISDYKMHQRIGYLSENHRFPEFLTAWQVLYYYGKMAGVDSALLANKTEQLLSTVKLGDWMHIKIHRFSKGMMQRLGLAHALINDPELIILDEPTDGIDPVGRREIRDLMVSLRDQGKTIFLNSHLLSEVERISDEVAILKEGKLLEKGRVEDFISVKQQYYLKLENSSEVLNRICSNENIPLQQQNGNTLIAVSDDNQLNLLIDQLRQSKVIIRGIIPRKITLEDFFIDVIEDKEMAS